MKSFIEIYDGALSEKDCEILISQFEKSPRSPGTVYAHGSNDPSVDPVAKKSIELVSPKFCKRDVISNTIRSALKPCLNRYKDTYGLADKNGEVNWHIDDSYTFQKFESEDDGFKVWHQEHGPGALSKRFLVWMFYLNYAQSGTDFKYFPTTPPKVGRCVVWPAGFPYIHRSHPNKGLKFIVSGWASYLY